MRARAAHATVLALAGLCAACAETSQGPAAGAASGATAAGSTGGARAPHAHPGARAMDRAFQRVATEGARCLSPGDRGALVRGAFDGATGEFRAERVTTPDGAQVPYAVETCVRVAAEHAHVRPFTEPRWSFAYAFAGAGGATGSAAPFSSGGAAVPTRPDAGAGASAPVASRPVVASGPTPAEVIRRDAEHYQRCYAEQGLSREHTLAGAVEVHATLDAAGRIAQLSTRAESNNPDTTLMELVARCIEARVRQLAFGPQGDPGNEVVVPLAFSP